MNLYFLLLVAAALAVAGGAWGQTETRVNVTGQRVNLRAKPDLRSEVVGQVTADDVLQARSFQGDWVEIVPPESIDLWVHKDFLAENQVVGSKLYVRAGPGINFNVVGTLDRGEVIAPRGSFGEWVKVAPPQAASLWITRSYIEVMEPQKTAPAILPETVEEDAVSMPEAPVAEAEPVMKAPVARKEHEGPIEAPSVVLAVPPPAAPRGARSPLQPRIQAPPVRIAVAEPPPAWKAFEPSPRVEIAQPPPIRTAAPVIRPAEAEAAPATAPAAAPPDAPVGPPTDVTLIPLECQGRAVQREGFLRPTGFLLQRPAAYRLVQYNGHKLETVCYLRGNDAQLSEFVTRRLLVRGREYWVRGARYPVVVPEQIVPRATR